MRVYLRKFGHHTTTFDPSWISPLGLMTNVPPEARQRGIGAGAYGVTNNWDLNLKYGMLRFSLSDTMVVQELPFDLEARIGTHLITVGLAGHRETQAMLEYRKLAYRPSILEGRDANPDMPWQHRDGQWTLTRSTRVTTTTHLKGLYPVTQAEAIRWACARLRDVAQARGVDLAYRYEAITSKLPYTGFVDLPTCREVIRQSVHANDALVDNVTHYVDTPVTGEAIAVCQLIEQELMLDLADMDVCNARAPNLAEEALYHVASTYHEGIELYDPIQNLSALRDSELPIWAELYASMNQALLALVKTMKLKS